MRILVVDKLASFRRRLRGWLVEGGHSSDNVLEASGGLPAMDLLRQEDFNVDAIICEWEQVAVGAADFLKQLRSVPGFAHIGFVAVGGAEPDRIAEAKAAGATEYLAQPLDPELLLRALVEIEKKAIDHRKRVASPTTRWRILTLDQKAPAGTQDGTLTAAAEQELRQGARTVYLNRSEALSLRPGDPLYWLEKGSLDVREVRGEGVVLEYKLGPGQFLGEAPFGGCPFVSLEARSEGECWLSSRDASTVDQLRARHPVLFYSFRNLANERARKFQKPDDKKPLERGLAGEIDSLPIGDLVGILNGAKKTGVLKIETGDATYFLQFTQGALRHAECEGEVGEDVFYRVVLLSKGRFEFMVGPAIEGPVTIALDTRALLIEGLRRRDQRGTRAPKPRPQSEA
ncbi:MAG: DUF4388 domain-containing protein [Planctomycetes bacterium]|nr:DUF4388 domain-containing protein [Planctomycetota bacterium]